MKYVIIGVGIAGIQAAKTIRQADQSAEILIVSKDTKVHSRCMLHKYIAGERDEIGLDFTEENFFTDYRIIWKAGETVTAVCPGDKKIVLATGAKIAYDKLLLANGSDSFIPPVGEFRKAANVFGLRNLSDAKAIVREADQARQVLIVGSGLVGLDAAYGIWERDHQKQITIVEMAPQILPVQLDAHAALTYQELFEQAGCQFLLGRKADQAVCQADGRIHQVVLDDGKKLDCDLVIVAAGVRTATGYLDGSGVECDRGVLTDAYMHTSQADIYAAGDITGLSGIWPNASVQGIAAGKNMCGIHTEYTDRYALKNTINFFGTVSLCVGRIKEEEGDVVLIKEDKDKYKRILVKNGCVEGILLQGDISNVGFWQYLIKNRIDISDIKKEIFHISYADFYKVGNQGKYEYLVRTV